jgi:type IV pilus assembly protein PilO
MKIEKINFSQLDFEQIGSWPLLLRIILFIVILGISLFAGYYITAESSYTTLDQTKHKLDDLKKQFVDSYTISINLEPHKKQLTEIEKNLNVQLQQIPNDDDISELLENISYQAVTSNLEIKLIKPGQILINNFYTTYDFTLTLSGTYHSLGKFSEKLAMLKRMVTVHDFKISVESSTQSDQFQLVPREPILEIELDLQTYWITKKNTTQTTAPAAPIVPPEPTAGGV